MHCNVNPVRSLRQKYAYKAYFCALYREKSKEYGHKMANDRLETYRLLTGSRNRKKGQKWGYSVEKGTGRLLQKPAGIPY